jgi:hypothetical protein
MTGIHIYAEWTGMTESERAAQWGCCGVENGHVGYLREAFDGEPYATKALVPEAFELDRAPIYAEKLQARLPDVLEIAEQREREIYGVTEDAEIKRVLQSYADFVELCARKEAETGEPCLIVASY